MFFLSQSIERHDPVVAERVPDFCCALEALSSGIRLLNDAMEREAHQYYLIGVSPLQEIVWYLYSHWFS